MKNPLFALALTQTLTSVLVWAQAEGFQHYGHFKQMMHTGETDGANAGRSGQGHAGQGGGHGGGHANQHTGMKVFREPQASGQLVGVYSGAKLEGIVSHPGERFHAHYIDNDLTVSGHLDHYNVRAGAILWLPKN